MNNKLIRIGALVVLIVGGSITGVVISESENPCSTANSTFIGDVIDTSLVGVDTSDALYICSFNIQFLGHFKKRDDCALADLMKNFDIVLVQELIAPPQEGDFPDGTKYKVDKEAKEFIDEMSDNGFTIVLSEEDTGPTKTIHKNNTSTEWWVAFYNDEKVEYATDLPHGFISEDRSQNSDYERVPYAFPFRVKGDTVDFVLISVHLAPDKSGKERREHELESIASWVEASDSMEKDFIILGDMNIEDSTELNEIIPAGYVSLNDECRRTNTLINDKKNQGAKPYDHIMYRPEFTGEEIDEEFDMIVLNLVDIMEQYWESEDPYPGNPYNHKLFKQYYSDHDPVVFRVVY